MSETHTNNSRYDRLIELLGDEALFGLGSEDRAELEELLAEFPDVDREELDRLAASIYLAEAELAATIPDHVREQLLAEAPGHHSPTKAVRPPDAPATGRPATMEAGTRGIATRELLAWFIAAAAVLVSVGLWNQTPIQPRSPEIELGPDTIVRDWQATDDETAKGASGQVKWSQENQRGVMTFEGLAANDPSEYQYQLWIFDEDQKHPIDGGVFDIPADAEGSVPVAINAKLHVKKPTLFAVTVEKPGGVVVSDQERIAVLAPVDDSA